MNLLSTNNSFYRYKIEDISDISETTYARRLAKSLQNNKKSFFFEVNKSLETSQIVADFLINKLRTYDCILTCIYNHPTLSKTVKSEQSILNIGNLNDLSIFNKKSQMHGFHLQNILFSPTTSTELKHFVEFQKNNIDKYNLFWNFVPYNEHLKNSLTVKEISKYNINYNTISGLEIFNTKIPPHYELEPTEHTSYKMNWRFSLNNSQPVISVIIPTFNNVKFLSNVIWHLINQNSPKEIYEIIIADDGSRDHSSDIIYELFEKYKNTVNLQYIYWGKKHPSRGDQSFFRPGLARNLASRYSNAKYLMFLDSDMLVPENFINTCILSLQTHDIIQFQRFHINQELSKANPIYKNVNVSKDTYIEETQYWAELFFSDDWAALPNHWKYTCTYALGIKKENFFQMGMFKKYYISYGFEDTDMGYEAYKRKFRFKLIKTPLLHLTSYNTMQYRNSFNKRFSLLRTTAELFYLQHLNRDIYHLFGNFYRAQKPVKSLFRDLIP